MLGERVPGSDFFFFWAQFSRELARLYEYSYHPCTVLALNSQMCATSVTLSYFHVHTAINILRCFGYPREHNFVLV